MPTGVADEGSVFIALFADVTEPLFEDSNGGLRFMHVLLSFLSSVMVDLFIAGGVAKPGDLAASVHTSNASTKKNCRIVNALLRRLAPWPLVGPMKGLSFISLLADVTEPWLEDSGVGPRFLHVLLSFLSPVIVDPFIADGVAKAGELVASVDTSKAWTKRTVA